MAKKPKDTSTPPLARQEWALAFESRVDRLRPGVGSKYLATIVATLYPKRHADDPEAVAVEWVKERGTS